MKKVPKILKILPVIYFSKEPGETQEQAVKRFMNILKDNGIEIESYNVSELEGVDNENV